ncbi:MAG: flagellar motor switch protein FliM, partial [Alphaproteobacteria bacterium]|nr:flagellar motor switch protein FliM [Alphaproteobacteria bacterium]
MNKDDNRNLMAGLSNLIGEDGDASPQLSQEEIDSLLGKKHRVIADVTGIQQLIESGQIYHERLPVLEAIFERFARLTSNSLRHFSSENIEITSDQTVSKRFDEYLNHVTLPA